MANKCMVSLIVSEHGRHLVEEGGRGLVVDVVVGWLLQGLGQWPTLSKETASIGGNEKCSYQDNPVPGGRNIDQNQKRFFRKIVFIPFLTLLKDENSLK